MEQTLQDIANFLKAIGNGEMASFRINSDGRIQLLNGLTSSECMTIKEFADQFDNPANSWPVFQTITYKDLKVGNSFKFVANQERIYKKINPIEDKWGNVFTAVSDSGSMLESQDFSETDNVYRIF